MSTSQSICVQSPRDVIPDLNVLWSSGTTWHGVTAEAYRFEDIETAEFQTVDHTLVLHLSSPALIELKVDGRCDTRTRVRGDLSIFPAAAVRQVRSAEPHEVLVVTVSQQVLAHSGFALRDATPFELPPRVFQRDAQLEHICWALKAEAESNYVSGSLYGESLALAVGAHLLRQHSASDSPSRHRGGIAPRVMRRVIDYIESNLDCPLRMASLAEIAGLSQYRFAHNFKSTTGLPPHQYVLFTRLERAKQMLRGTNRSILDIAYAVGCQSCSRFNSLFRRELGTTPSAYRSSFR
jgi:AraC family transcriptional regulator